MNIFHRTHEDIFRNFQLKLWKMMQVRVRVGVKVQKIEVALIRPKTKTHFPLQQLKKRVLSCKE